MKLKNNSKMTKTTVEFIKKEGKRSYEIKVDNDNALTGPFFIPVVDVRDGNYERLYANEILKADKINGRSKFLHPSFGSGGGSYQVSRKGGNIG